MDRYEHHVSAGIHEFHRLLRASIHIGLDQSAVLSHAMVDMHHIIAQAHGVQVVDRHLLQTFHLTAHRQFVVPFEDLVVGIIAVFRTFVDITFV